MALKYLEFKPGLYSEGTDLGAGKEGYWKDADHVRFYDGLPQKIGGWEKLLPTQLEGKVRGTTDWRSIDTEVRHIAFGSNIKLYVYIGGAVSDITPYRASGTLANPFSTTDTLTTVTVAHVAHGCSVSDRVHFSGVSAVGGITIDGEYIVTSVPTGDEFTIEHTSSATSTAGPGGGGSVAYGYEISIGGDSGSIKAGWGAGLWSAETWGTPRTVSEFTASARTWSMDTWGQDLVCAPRQGGIYTWVSSSGPSVRAVLISQAPATAHAVMVSQEDQHLIALGAHDGVASDPLLIRWCSQSDYTEWTPTLDNTAGDKRLDQGNEILCGHKVRGEMVIFTDSYMYSMQFVGPPYTFAFRPLGDNGGLVGENAVAVFEGVAYWMGTQEFYTYDGTIRVLECTINNEVFVDPSNSIDTAQGAKVWAGVNRQFNEVWWLYQSIDGSEVDRYVIYSVQEKAWSYGTMARTVLVGNSDVFDFAYGVGADGYIYTHEIGVDADGAALPSYIESGDVEIDADGAQMQHVSKYIPDFKRLSGSAAVTLTGRRYPQDSETQSSGPHTVTSSTKFINPRVRARQMSIRLETEDIGEDWRMGILRIDAMPHGGR